MAFLLTQNVYHAMTLINKDVTQKFNGITCKKLPERSCAGRGKNSTSSICKIQAEGLYEAKIRYFFSRFLLIY